MSARNKHLLREELKEPQAVKLYPRKAKHFEQHSARWGVLRKFQAGMWGRKRIRIRMHSLQSGLLKCSPRFLFTSSYLLPESDQLYGDDEQKNNTLVKTMKLFLKNSTKRRWPQAEYYCEYSHEACTALHGHFVCDAKQPFLGCRQRTGVTSAGNLVGRRN